MLEDMGFKSDPSKLVHGRDGSIFNPDAKFFHELPKGKILYRFALHESEITCPECLKILKERKQKEKNNAK